MTQAIADKVVMITGASSGLGEATTMALPKQDARLALCARRADRIQSLAHQLTHAGGKAMAVAMDVTDHAQLKQLVDVTAREYGRIDVMINNAGIMPQALLERVQIGQ